MPNVNLSTDPETAHVANTSDAFFFNAGDLGEILKKNFADETGDISDVMEMIYDEDDLAENSGKGNPIYDVAKEITKEMWETYQGYKEKAPDQITIVFENSTKYGLFPYFLIKDMIAVLHSSSYKARGLSGYDFEGIRETISANIAALMGDMGEDEEEEEDHYLKDEGEDDDMGAEFGDDLDEDDANVEDDVQDQVADVERQNEADSFQLPRTFFEVKITPAEFMRLLKEKPSVSQTRSVKLDSGSSSYNFSDQGKLTLLDRSQYTLYFVKKPISKTSVEIYPKTISGVTTG